MDRVNKISSVDMSPHLNNFTTHCILSHSTLSQKTDFKLVFYTLYKWSRRGGGGKCVSGLLYRLYLHSLSVCCGAVVVVFLDTLLITINLITNREDKARISCRCGSYCRCGGPKGEWTK